MERLTPVRALACVALALTLSCSLAAFHGQLDDDYGSGFFGTNGAAYCGRIVTNLVEFPVSVTRLGAPMFVLEGSAGDPLVLHYTNHPPGYYALLAAGAKLFGATPLALKLTALFFHIATALCIAFFFLPARPHAAMAAGVLAAALPAASFYGFMCSAFGPSTFLAVLALLAFKRCTTHSGAGWLLRSTLFMAGFLDWNSILLIPCAIAAALIGRRWKLALDSALAGGAGLLLLLLHSLWILGSGEALLTEVARLGTGSSLAPGFIDSGWWAGLAAHLDALYGIPVMVLAAFALAWRCKLSRAETILALGPGVLLMAAFSSHALEHDYWQQALLPALTLLAGGVLGEGLASRAVLLRLAAGALLFSIALHGLMSASSRLEAALTSDGTRELARALESVTLPGDVVLLPGAHLEGIAAHTTRQVLTGFSSLEMVTHALDVRGEIVPRLGSQRLMLIVPVDWPDREFIAAIEKLAPGTAAGPVVVHSLRSPR